MRKLQTQGIHHITFVGADRQTSIDLWEGLLGMPFIFEQPNLDVPEESHLYFDPGDGRLITVFTNENRTPDPTHTPEAAGDYMAGPNHTLPTGGTARFFSPLGVDDFVKKSSLVHFTPDGLKRLGKQIIKVAELEGLTAHARSVSIRLENE